MENSFLIFCFFSIYFFRRVGVFKKRPLLSYCLYKIFLQKEGYNMENEKERSGGFVSRMIKENFEDAKQSAPKPDFAKLMEKMEERNRNREMKEPPVMSGGNTDKYTGNCYVSAETFCGLYNDGRLQSFDDCVKDVRDTLAEDMLNGKNVYICRENGDPIAKCSISEDNKLEVQYADREEVEEFDFDKETLGEIENMRVDSENAKEVEPRSNDKSDDFER